MLIIRTKNEFGEDKKFTFHVGWFIFLLVMFFLGFGGLFSGIIFADVGKFVVIGSAVILGGIFLTLLIESVSVIKVFIWLFKEGFSFRTQFDFPVQHYELIGDKQEKIKESSLQHDNNSREIGHLSTKTYTINLFPIFWKFGLLIIVQIFGAVGPEGGVLLIILNIFNFAVFIWLLRTLSPAFKAWWYAMGRKSVSYLYESDPHRCIIKIHEKD